LKCKIDLYPLIGAISVSKYNSNPLIPKMFVSKYNLWIRSTGVWDVVAIEGHHMAKHI
jgi:hypothetical protein